MAEYSGTIVTIPVGRSGLRTDDANYLLGPESLIRALNVRYESGVIEKEFGSRRWNQTVLGAAVLAGIDFRATESERRVVVALGDGTVRTFENAFSSQEITGATVSYADGANLVQGGSEESGNPRKLFIFSPTAYPQVVIGNSLTRANIDNGLPEWSGSANPIDGIIHRNRMFVWTRFGSTMFGSDPLDHEDFLTDPLPLEVYPGVGERIATAFVFRKKLFVLKYPKGVFVLNDESADSDEWYFEKINESEGGVSSRAIVQARNDALYRNYFGGISMLSGVETAGDFDTNNLFDLVRAQSFVDEQMTPNPDHAYHAIYHSQKKTAYFSYRSSTGSENDRICMIDFSDPSRPRISWLDKDQPTCMFLMRDSSGVERPYYGADDGYIYEMSSENRWVGGDTEASGTAYSMDFQTPHMDLGGEDPLLATAMKQFDFLEVVYEPEGDWELTVDVYIDGRFTETLKFKMSVDKDGSELDTPFMTFDNGNLDPQIEQSRILQIRGSGKKISFRCYNSGKGQNCRIAKLGVYFKRLGNDQKR